MHSEDSEGQEEMDEAGEVRGVAGMSGEETDGSAHVGTVGDEDNAGITMDLGNGDGENRTGTAGCERGGVGSGVTPGRALELGCCSVQMSSVGSDRGLVTWRCLFFGIVAGCASTGKGPSVR